MSKILISKNINSILQVTNDVIYKNNNYRDYIINENNSLYIRQLPLLIKNERINALVAKKYDDPKKNSSLILEEEIKNNNSMSSFPLLKGIRNLKIRSKKLPPLCPLYNDRGELVPSEIKTSKIVYKRINYDNFLNNINSGLGFPKKMKPIFKKPEIKKLKYNKSCDFDIRIKLDDLENNYFNKPEYEHLIYDENLIIGNKTTYEEIIKNKIIELQTEYNKNDTIQKEKIYKYGSNKRDIILTLDSLKIKIYDIKDENGLIIEKKGNEPYFQYTLPFALLPLFYFKGIEPFLIILTKIIIFNDKNLKFSIAENCNEIISKVLKNCADFFIFDENEFNLAEKEVNENDLNYGDMSPISKNNGQRKNSYSNNVINYENKNVNNINSPINNISSSPQNKKSLFFQNETSEQGTNQNNNISSNNINTSSLNNNADFSAINSNAISGIDMRDLTSDFNNKASIKTFGIYASKKNEEEIKFISQYEFFWITPTKSFLLSIETPLITLYAPSNNNYIKQYINFELLFYIYQNNFIMWDFYIMKYLSTLKNFRLFMEQLYSIPLKMNVSFFLTIPKVKKILSTNFEIASIITRPLSEKQKKFNNDNSKSEKDIKKTQASKNSKKLISYKTKTYSQVKLYKDLSSTSPNKNRYSGQFVPDEKLITPLSKIPKSNININNKFSTFNSIFIQKGLIFVASLINQEKETINEYCIHFNVDQLRKFQIMEVMQDKLTFFMKFMHVNYDTESISFDFEAFEEFNEINWITDVNKYNFNYLSQHKVISEENVVDENGEDIRAIKIFKGLYENTTIKVEMKCPLILIQDLDDFCFKVTERVNVDSKVERILSQIKIHNTLDLTKQLINILRDHNFCRKIITTRNIKKKTTKKKTTSRLNSKRQINLYNGYNDSKKN